MFSGRWQESKTIYTPLTVQVRHPSALSSKQHPFSVSFGSILQTSVPRTNTRHVLHGIRLALSFFYVSFSRLSLHVSFSRLTPTLFSRYPASPQRAIHHPRGQKRKCGRATETREGGCRGQRERPGFGHRVLMLEERKHARRDSGGTGSKLDGRFPWTLMALGRCSLLSFLLVLLVHPFPSWPCARPQL